MGLGPGGSGPPGTMGNPGAGAGGTIALGRTPCHESATPSSASAARELGGRRERRLGHERQGQRARALFSARDRPRGHAEGRAGRRQRQRFHDTAPGDGRHRLAAAGLLDVLQPFRVEELDGEALVGQPVHRREWRRRPSLEGVTALGEAEVVRGGRGPAPRRKRVPAVPAGGRERGEGGERGEEEGGAIGHHWRTARIVVPWREAAWRITGLPVAGSGG